MGIRENLQEIIEMKNRAAKDAGKNPESVILCAVTKTRTPEEINEAINCGVTDIGENKVQEIVDKYDKVLPVRWHLIGHLQTNKVRHVIDKVDMIHSCDSLKLAEEINKRCEQHGKDMDILIQVNVAKEEQKFGVAEEELENLLDEILNNFPRLRVRGLMFIAPAADNPEDVAEYFRKMKDIYDKLSVKKHERCDFKYLSMGMSGDFEVAIREGSNFVRVGTAIFGARNYNKI